MLYLSNSKRVVMELSFQCNQDLKGMPTMQGKKFCDHCQKHVFDLRRKSDEKVAAFFRDHQKPCVIIYQEQLDKLPKRQAQPHSGLSYFPYAASLAAVSLLPQLTIAQTEVIHHTQTIGSIPIAIPSIKNKDNAESVAKKDEVYDSYILSGRVNIRDKKMKIKKGKEFLIFRSVLDSSGYYSGRDTIVSGKLDMNGKFKLKLSKEQFEIINADQEELRINVDVFRGERIEEFSVDKNKVNMQISVSAKRRVLMGAYF